MKKEREREREENHLPVKNLHKSHISCKAFEEKPEETDEMTCHFTKQKLKGDHINGQMAALKVVICHYKQSELKDLNKNNMVYVLPKNFLPVRKGRNDVYSTYAREHTFCGLCFPGICVPLKRTVAYGICCHQGLWVLWHI